MTKVKGSATETTETPDGATVSSSQLVDGPNDAKPGEEEPQARVNASVGFTRNTGQYNNVKYGCSLTLPCNLDEINDVYEFAVDWCEQKLQAKMEEVNEAYGLN